MIILSSSKNLPYSLIISSLHIVYKIIENKTRAIAKIITKFYLFRHKKTNIFLHTTNKKSIAKKDRLK